VEAFDGAISQDLRLDRKWTELDKHMMFKGALALLWQLRINGLVQAAIGTIIP
jgi:hypothetical protein